MKPSPHRGDARPKRSLGSPLRVFERGRRTSARWGEPGAAHNPEVDMNRTMRCLLVAAALALAAPIGGCQTWNAVYSTFTSTSTTQENVL